jgi:hypothetical protein
MQHVLSPTVATVRAFPLIIDQGKPFWAGLISAGFEIRKNHRTEAAVVTEVSEFTVRVWGSKFGSFVFYISAGLNHRAHD